MAERGYGQFCPVAMACEALGSRWTLLIVRELLAGSTRFNELRRGLPRISPGLLSKRLGELEVVGVIERVVAEDRGHHAYHLTEAGRQLGPIVMALGGWGQRWLESQLSLDNLDPSLLMWDMRRNLDPGPMPAGRSTIQFEYVDVTRGQKLWWLIVDNDGGTTSVDLCMIDPGQEVDLYVVSELRAMTAIWMGITSVGEATSSGELSLTGSRSLEEGFERWLGRSVFAHESKRVRAD